jgi:hypothetical protein
MAKKNCNKFQYNPFEIDLKDIGDCQVPALFLYCEEDSVINCQNTHLICAKYKAVFEKLVIEENHNTVRSQATLEKIFDFIEKYAKKPKARTCKNNGSLHLDPQPSSRRYDTPSKLKSSKGEKSLDDSAEQRSALRKGIERVNV